MKKWIFIVSLFVSLNGFSQKKCGYTISEDTTIQNKALSSFLSAIPKGKFEVKNDKSAIPKQVKKQLDCLANKFDLANPKEEYQEGCTAPKTLPKRKLLFLAKSKEMMAMSYATGGIASFTHYVLLQYNAKGITNMWIGLSMGVFKHKTVEELTQFVRGPRDSTENLNMHVSSL